MTFFDFVQSNIVLIVGAIVVIVLVVLFTTYEPMDTEEVQSNVHPDLYDDVFDDAPMYQEINKNLNQPSAKPNLANADLSAFYEDDLKGDTEEYDMDKNSGMTDNVDADYTLGVNPEDTENKDLGLVQTANKLKSSDLLPKDKKDWFDTPQVGKTIEDANLLADATFRIGLDTVVTKRGMTTDPRGSIHVPKINVSPWNQSSRDPNPTSGWCN